MPSMEFARIDPKTRELYFVSDFPQVSLFGPGQQPAGVGIVDIGAKAMPDLTGLMEDIPFIVTTSSPFLQAERALAAGFGIDIADLGPNDQIVISIDSADILALVSGAGFVGQVEVQYNGTTVATRGGIDFREGAGVSITALDDPFANVVRLTFAFDTTSVNIDDLADVNAAGTAAGSILEYDGTQWTAVANDELSATPGGQPHLSVRTDGSLLFRDGDFAAALDRGARRWIVAGTTTDATPTSLTIPTTGGKVPVYTNSVAFFEIDVAAREVGGSNAGGWRLRGVVARDGAAATTRFVGGGPSQELVAEDVAGWDATVVIDTTAGALDIVVTGAAGTNIRWIAEVRTVYLFV